MNEIITVVSSRGSGMSLSAGVFAIKMKQVLQETPHPILNEYICKRLGLKTST